MLTAVRSSSKKGSTMPGIMDILGLVPELTYEEKVAQVEADLTMIERLWADDDMDCISARAFAASCRVWYEFMKVQGDEIRSGGDKRLNRILHGAYHEYMTGAARTMAELLALGRLRCDAIESATGTNPVPREKRKPQADDMPEGWENYVRDAS